MPGEKMLKSLNEADVKKDWIDAQELADALKNLKPDQLQRWLKNKSEKISTVPGIADAVKDLIAKHTDGFELNPNQTQWLYALHAIISEGGSINLKKMWSSINEGKESVQNQLWQNNIDKTLDGSDYTFVDWLADGWKDNQWTAVITKWDERYHVNFSPDGSLKTTSIKETYNRDGVLQKDAPEKVAYIGIDKKFVVEDKELFDKKAKTKEFANKLDELSVDGVFLKKQKDDGSMDVAYFSDAALSTVVKPIFEKGDGIDPTVKKTFDTYNSSIALAEKAKIDAQSNFDVKKSTIDSKTSTTTEDWRKWEIAQLQTILDGELKKQQSILDANNENLLDLYKTYALSNTESLFDKSTDAFTIQNDLSLVGALWESLPLNIDGKKDPESVSGHVSLDKGNLLLKIDKTPTSTGWTAYKKKAGVDGAASYITQSNKWVDAVNPVEKPTEVVSENTELETRIDALGDGFMFNGWIVDKTTALKSTKDALKTLIEKWKVDNVDWMVQNLEWSTLTDLPADQRLLTTRNVQESVNQIIKDNSLKFSINSPYFINGKLKPDGRWGKISTEALVQVANALPEKTLEAPTGTTSAAPTGIIAEAPKGTTAEAPTGITESANTVVDNTDLISSVNKDYPTLSDLLSIPTDKEIKKESIDNFPSNEWKATKLLWDADDKQHTAYVFDNKLNSSKKFASLNTYTPEFKSTDSMLYIKDNLIGSMQDWNQDDNNIVQKFDFDKGQVWSSFNKTKRELSFNSNSIWEVLKSDLQSPETSDSVYTKSMETINKSLDITQAV